MFRGKFKNINADAAIYMPVNRKEQRASGYVRN
jgi:hypothetical protein